MQFLFPYDLVPKNSNIILYGEGVVGKEFYLQLRLNQYCNIVRWVDRAFDYYEIDEPFDRVSNINNYTYDYVVIAVADYALAQKIEKELVELKVPHEKIVWSRFYSVGASIFPNNRSLYLTNFSFFIELIETYMKKKDFYGGACFYQGHPELGINGARKNAERIERYRIKELLSKEMTVLDIGCNVGFFDLCLSKYVKEVHGFDIEKEYIKIANMTKDFLHIDNVLFEEKNAMDITESKYDAIFSLGVHNYIFENGVSRLEYVQKIKDMMNDNGLIFFESHGMNADAAQYKEICDLFASEGMQKLFETHSWDDGNRNTIVYQKVRA